MSWNTGSVYRAAYGAWPVDGDAESPIFVASIRKDDLVLAWQSEYQPLEALKYISPNVDTSLLSFRSTESPNALVGLVSDENLRATVRSPLEIRAKTGRRSFISLLSESGDVEGPAVEWTVGNRATLHEEVRTLWPFVLQTGTGPILEEPDDAMSAAITVLFDIRKFARDFPSWDL